MDERREAARLALFQRFREEGAIEWVGAAGTSMLPGIAEGDLVLVDFGARRPRLGEVVVYPAGGRLVVHRVVRRDRDGEVLTKGDNTESVDPPVRTADILGTVRAVRRGADGPAVSRGCAGTRAVALALLSSGAARGLELTRHVPRRIRHPLSRPARALVEAAFRAATPGGRSKDGAYH